MPDLSALAGVSVSTISRTEAGKVVPSADAYRRILRAAGFIDGGTHLEALSRPSAVWTARWLLGALPNTPPGAEDWIPAWQRAGLVNPDGTVAEEERLMFRAGRSAVLASRPTVVTALSQMPVEQIAAAFERDGVEYAITGDEALERYGGSIIPAWPTAYVSDLPTAVTSLGLVPRVAGQLGRLVSLIAFDGFSEVDRVQADDGIWFVAPIQAILDAYGGYGRMVEQAQWVVEGWIADETMGAETASLQKMAATYG
jgi:hypothetical protein